MQAEQIKSRRQTWREIIVNDGHLLGEHALHYDKLNNVKVQKVPKVAYWCYIFILTFYKDGNKALTQVIHMHAALKTKHISQNGDLTTLLHQQPLFTEDGLSVSVVSWHDSLKGDVW